MRFEPFFSWLKRIWRRRPPEPSQVVFNQRRYDIHALPPLKAIPSDEELGVVRAGPGMCFVKPCEHRDEPRAFAYRVFETELSLQIPTRCPDCMQTFLETVCERCAECGRAIAIGFQVAKAWIGAPHPYTHLQCAENPLLFCGLWGVGQLTPLSDLKDDVTAGTATLLAHAIEEARQQTEDILKARQETPAEEPSSENGGGSGTNGSN